MCVTSDCHYQWNLNQSDANDGKFAPTLGASEQGHRSRSAFSLFLDSIILTLIKIELIN